MLSTAPHLQVRRPSPSTAEFTVTTRPPLTLGLRAALAVVFVGRIVLALSALLLVHSKWRETFASSPPPHQQSHDHGPPASSSSSSTSSSSSSPTPHFFSSFLEGDNTATTVLHLAATALAAAHASPPGRLLARASAACPAWLLAPLCALLVHAAQLRVHTSESLLVLRGLGVQTRSQGPGCLFSSGGLLSFASSSSGAAAGRFIPVEKVRDVLINEAFLGFEVRYYLVIVVEGEEELVVVFPRLLPRRRIVEAVWRGVRGCLYEPESSGRPNAKA